ncbi:MAG: TAXI family TRAP transporter solute-binding subunit, partial [Kiloniellaceae bacterium]
MGLGTIIRHLVMAAALTGAATTPAVAADSTLTIGTGSRAGVYYQAGRAICRLVETAADLPGTACQAPTTAGSIANLRDLRAGELQLAIVQSDWQYHAVNGSDRFAEDTPDSALRALFSLHGEAFTLVARR